MTQNFQIDKTFVAVGKTSSSKFTSWLRIKLFPGHRALTEL